MSSCFFISSELSKSGTLTLPLLGGDALFAKPFPFSAEVSLLAMVVAVDLILLERDKGSPQSGKVLRN